LFKTDKKSALGNFSYGEESEKTAPSITSLSIHKTDPEKEIMGEEEENLA
jgi:hypothetical protein